MNPIEEVPVMVEIRTDGTIHIFMGDAELYFRDRGEARKFADGLLDLLNVNP